MIRQSILIIFFSFGPFSFCYGQINNQFDKYNFDTACNDGNLSQQEINICIGKVLEKLNKVMGNKCLYLESSIDSLIKDTTNNSKDRIADYKRIKSILISSQIAWERLEENNSEFYKTFYGQGTELPMYYGLSKIQDIKDRLKRIDDFIETLGQEKESLIKCK